MDGPGGVVFINDMFLICTSPFPTERMRLDVKIVCMIRDHI